eukprot:5343617-Prymnesium_polylepis.1
MCGPGDGRWRAAVARGAGAGGGAAVPPAAVHAHAALRWSVAVRRADAAADGRGGRGGMGSGCSIQYEAHEVCRRT